LNNNKLAKFSTASLKTNSKLQKLHLQKNQIQEFTVPTVMNSITYVDLQYNSLTTVPDLEKLTSLTILILSHNKLALNDASFTKVPKSLKQLFLSDVNFAAVQSAYPFKMFASFSNLYSLSVSRNGLTALVFEKFPKLSQLNTLMLYDNAFTSIDFTNVKDKLPKLENIGLSQKTWSCDKLASMLANLESQNINRFFYRGSYKVFGIGNNIENIGCVNAAISEDMEKKFASLKAKNDALEVKQNEMTTKMSNAETTIQASKKTVSELNEQVKNLKLKDEQLETNVGVVKSDVEKLTGSFEELDRVQNALSVDIIDITKEVENPTCIKFEKCKVD
jgi:Leucine-rich repeat (LRR) protein